MGGGVDELGAYGGGGGVCVEGAGEGEAGGLAGGDRVVGGVSGVLVPDGDCGEEGGDDGEEAGVDDVGVEGEGYYEGGVIFGGSDAEGD